MRKSNYRKLIGITTVVAVGIAFLATQNMSRVEAEEKIYPATISMQQEESVDTASSDKETQIETDTDIDQDKTINEGEETKSSEKENQEEQTEPSDTTQDTDQEISDDGENQHETDVQETESVEETETPKEKPSETHHEANTPLSRNRDLKENEVIVNSWSEFTKLLRTEGDGIYDTYYMGDDFEVTSSPIHPRNYSFTLDGRDFETGEIHTFNVSSSSVGLISSLSLEPTTITYQNMIINGKNTNGVVRGSYEFTTIIMDNIDFTGPLLAQNADGTTIIRDSKVVNETNETFYKGNNLILEGNVSFDNTTSRQGTAYSAAKGTLTIAEDANIDFKVSGLFASVGTFNMLPGATLTLEHDSSKINLVSFTNFFSADTFNMDSGSLSIKKYSEKVASSLLKSKNLNVKNSKIDIDFDTVWSIIDSSGDLSFTEGSEVHINGEASSFTTINTSSRTSPIALEDSKMIVKMDSTPTFLSASYSSLKVTNSYLELDFLESRGSELNFAKGIEITDNSIVNITVEGTATPVLKSAETIVLNDSELNINIVGSKATTDRYSVVEAKNYTSHNGKFFLDSVDNEYTTLFDVSGLLKISGDAESQYWTTFRSAFRVDLIKKREDTKCRV